MRRFTSKNHVYENFDVIKIQRRFAASFPDKTLFRNRPAFNSKEKSRGLSISSYSRIGSIERALELCPEIHSVRCTPISISTITSVKRY